MRAAVCLLIVGLQAASVRAADVPPPEAAYRGADPVLLEQVRARFKAATESGKTTGELVALMDGRLPADPAEWPAIFRAYRASLEGLIGKHSLKPWDKYVRVKAALAQFAGLVEAHPESIEIRGLRFAFYFQIPKLFDVRPQALADRAVLADLLLRREDPTVTATYCREMAEWILQNGAPLPAERKKLAVALARPD
ncbi:MAG: hypothetical protein AB7V22_10570 [Kiritimatiellia bacterium]